MEFNPPLNHASSKQIPLLFDSLDADMKLRLLAFLKSDYMKSAEELLTDLKAELERPTPSS